MSFSAPNTLQKTVPSVSLALAARRHDLDALRAFAMLLGLALHASLSFFPAPWPVQDTRQSELFAIFNALIHGFRMPLFFLLSGYFTMMMYRSRGMKSLLKQRAIRILIPCLVGMLTFVPLMSLVSSWAMQAPRPQLNDPQQSLVAAIRAGDVSAVGRALDGGIDLQRSDARFNIRPLHWGSLVGHEETVSLLIERGADVNLANDDGNTPLHAAAFLGHSSVVEILLNAGADANALNREGDPAISGVDAPEEVTIGIAEFLELSVPEPLKLEAGRKQVRALLQPITTIAGEADAAANKPTGWLDRTAWAYTTFMNSDEFVLSIGGKPFHVLNSRMFDHLWFLWFLCWEVAIFSSFMWVASLFQRRDSPAPQRVSMRSCLWLIPVTVIPQVFMGVAFPQFGPDTSTGVIPQPHVLLYYSLFFAFGVGYFSVGDPEAKLGRHWWLLLPLGLCVIFPLGRATMENRLLSSFIQPAYTWAMSIGMMGLFHATMNRPSRVVRYASDASYWMYLAHLPLVIGFQAIVRPWPAAPLLKFLLINTVTVGLLLVTYDLCVRYTWIGLVLNGRRKRSATWSVGESTGDGRPAGTSVTFK